MDRRRCLSGWDRITAVGIFREIISGEGKGQAPAAPAVPDRASPAFSLQVFLLSERPDQFGLLPYLFQGSIL